MTRSSVAAVGVKSSVASVSETPLGTGRRGLVAHAIVAVAFDFVREFRAAGLDDAPVDQDLHDVRRDVLNDARIVRDDEEADVLALIALAQGVDAPADR